MFVQIIINFDPKEKIFVQLCCMIVIISKRY